MKSIGKTWRNSSSLLLLSKRVGVKSPEAGNMEVLVQTRPERASTFANSVVFPGGVAESADDSPQWIDLIKSFGYSQSHFDALYQTGTNISPLFHNNPVQRHISLRITAVRETFEELGVLVCSSKRVNQAPDFWASWCGNFNVKDWQEKVSKDPSELYNLCQKLGCYPDIWSLHYWSNWLTPASFDKRFNTAFFIAAVQDKPSVLESSEVFSSKWTSPEEILTQKREKQVVLLPPQAYEFMRIAEFSSVGEVIAYAKKTSPIRNVLFHPVFVEAGDGMVQLLPGDDLYPTIKDYAHSSIKRKDETVRQLREGCDSLNRLEQIQGISTLVIKNLTLLNHITMSDKIITLN